MTNNEIVVRALANTGITALNEMQQAVLDAGTTKDMVLLSPTGSGKTLAFLLPLLTTLTDEDKKIQAVIDQLPELIKTTTEFNAGLNLEKE